MYLRLSHRRKRMTRIPNLALAVTAIAWFAVSAAFAQKDPTFSQNPVAIKGLKQTSTITITSPYDDCTMTITATSTNPAVATVTPPGPVVSNNPVTFTITSGLRPGT